MNSISISTDDILEVLDLSRAEPGIGFLEALFERFNARVPFETATKILRRAQVRDLEDMPRRPDLFWREHLEQGAGGTCFARVAAFAALLTDLGYEARPVLGQVEREFDHAAVWVTNRQRPWICDVGFPLPAVLPAAAGEVETALGLLAVSETPRGFRIQFSDGVPEGPRSLEVFGAAVAPAEFDERWRATFRPESRFLSSVVLRRQARGRVVSFARGVVRVDDRHTRLAVPLTESRPARLADVFEIERELLDQAFGIVGDPAPDHTDSRLTAYLSSIASPPDAFAAIATLAGYRRLLEGVARIESEEATSDGWRIVLAPPPADGQTSDPALIEDVSPRPDQRELRVRRRAGSREFESLFRAQELQGKSYLVREAILAGPREDLLTNDALRGRLAGSLAVDLLAWARLIGSGN
jgi:arylamine N-acetyltransferase